MEEECQVQIRQELPARPLEWSSFAVCTDAMPNIWDQWRRVQWRRSSRLHDSWCNALWRVMLRRTHSQLLHYNFRLVCRWWRARASLAADETNPPCQLSSLSLQVHAAWQQIDLTHSPCVGYSSTCNQTRPLGVCLICWRVLRRARDEEIDHVHCTWWAQPGTIKANDDRSQALGQNRQKRGIQLSLGSERVSRIGFATKWRKWKAVQPWQAS